MNSRQKPKHDCNGWPLKSVNCHTTFFQRSFLHRQSDDAASFCSVLTLVSLRRAAGFQDGPDHSHEGSRLVPAEPRRLLCPRRPVEAGVGEGRPGSRQPPVHPTARHQVGQIKKDRRRVSSDPLLSLIRNQGEANLKVCFLREPLFWSAVAGALQFYPPKETFIWHFRLCFCKMAGPFKKLSTWGLTAVGRVQQPDA